MSHTAMVRSWSVSRVCECACVSVCVCVCVCVCVESHLGAGDHGGVTEAKVEHSLTVVNQGVQHHSSINTPHSEQDTHLHTHTHIHVHSHTTYTRIHNTSTHTHTCTVHIYIVCIYIHTHISHTHSSPYGGIAGASDNDLLVVLQTQHRPSVTLQYPSTLHIIPVPYLNTHTHTHTHTHTERESYVHVTHGYVRLQTFLKSHNSSTRYSTHNNTDTNTLTHTQLHVRYTS